MKIRKKQPWHDCVLYNGDNQYEIDAMLEGKATFIESGQALHLIYMHHYYQIQPNDVIAKHVNGNGLFVVKQSDLNEWESE